MTARDFSASQITDPHQRKRIEENTFFYQQATKRIIAQFSESQMEKEANEYAEAIYEEMGQRFDPDIQDEGSLAEDAHYASTEFYRMLVEMRDNIRLGLVANMFHNWDKEVRDWTAQLSWRWSGSDRLKRAIWEARIDEIFELLKGFGFDVKAHDFFQDLEACRLVVNAFKHGDGGSYDKLKVEFPRFTENASPSIYASNLNIRLVAYRHVEVSNEDFKRFSDAINQFWLRVPVGAVEAEADHIPKRFRNAIENPG